MHTTPLQRESDALSLASLLPYVYCDSCIVIVLNFKKQIDLSRDHRMFYNNMCMHTIAERERRVEPGECLAQRAHTRR